MVTHLRSSFTTSAMSDPPPELFNDDDEPVPESPSSAILNQQVTSDEGEESSNDNKNLIGDSEEEEEQDNDDEMDSASEDGEEIGDEIEKQDDDEDIEEAPKHKVKQFKKGKKSRIAQFIDDEAELSGDDAVSDDEADGSDDDQLDPELVDLDAKDLGSDEEEEVRRLYHKQLDTDDRRQLLLLQEQLEENEIAIGQRRRRKFRWQTRELMENSLKRHYDPDDDDSQEGDEDDLDDFDYESLQPKLRRPVGSLVLGSTKLLTEVKSSHITNPFEDESQSNSNFAEPRTYSRIRSERRGESGPSLLSDDSNSNTANSRSMAQSSRSNRPEDMNRYLFRDKEIVDALNSARETVIVTTREEKDRVIQRELKRVIQSKSIFDQLYS